MTDLLSILVEHSKSPLVISKLEEDAAVYEVGGCYKQKQKTWLHTVKQSDILRRIVIFDYHSKGFIKRVEGVGVC